MASKPQTATMARHYTYLYGALFTRAQRVAAASMHGTLGNLRAQWGIPYSQPKVVRPVTVGGRSVPISSPNRVPYRTAYHGQNAVTARYLCQQTVRGHRVQ